MSSTRGPIARSSRLALKTWASVLPIYAFHRTLNVGALRYNPKLPLFWALDFNMNPLCSVVGQTSNGKVFILDELGSCRTPTRWLPVRSCNAPKNG
jgi:hypothetical protein